MAHFPDLGPRYGYPQQRPPVNTPQKESWEETLERWTVGRASNFVQIGIYGVGTVAQVAKVAVKLLCFPVVIGATCASCCSDESSKEGTWTKSWSVTGVVKDIGMTARCLKSTVGSLIYVGWSPRNPRQEKDSKRDHYETVGEACGNVCRNVFLGKYHNKPLPCCSRDDTSEASTVTDPSRADSQGVEWEEAELPSHAENMTTHIDPQSSDDQ